MFKRLLTKKMKSTGMQIHSGSARHQDVTGGDPKLQGAWAPIEHSCGIPPWKVTHTLKEQKPREEFPSHLIRPPCDPAHEIAGFQTCVKGTEGYYCLPCRQKYKYPPFSENIDFVPPFQLEPPCWWKTVPKCWTSTDAKALEGLTKRWPCNYDDVAIE